MTLPAKLRASITEDVTFESSQETWKRFGYNSEAGRLLHQLYGQGKKRHVIRYPKIKIDPTLVAPKDSGIWVNTLTSDQTDPRSDSNRRVREQSLKVPKCSVIQQPKTPAIETVPKRKCFTKITEELNDIERSNQQYRPIPRKAISTDIEKRRLALCHQFNGGKALPGNSTSGRLTKNIPLHLITGKLTQKTMERIHKAKELKVAAIEGQKTKDRACLEQQFDHVESELTVLRQAIAEATRRRNNRRVGILRQQLSQNIVEMRRIDDILNKTAK